MSPLKPVRVLAVLAALACAAPAPAAAQHFAVDQSYTDVSGWNVGLSRRFGGCVATTRYEDGTTVWIGFHGDGSGGFIAMANASWDEVEVDGTYQLNLQAIGGGGNWNGTFRGFRQQGRLMGVVHFGLADNFMRDFARAQGLVVRQGRRQYARLSLRGSRAALDAVLECHRQYAFNPNRRNDQAEGDQQQRERQREAHVPEGQRGRANPRDQVAPGGGQREEAEPPPQRGRERDPNREMPPQERQREARDTPPEQRRPQPETGISTGTGFFVSTTGHVLTNAHVVEGCTRIAVVRPGSEQQQATLSARDAVNDLALLTTTIRIERIASFDTRLRVGETVSAYGFPLSGVLSSTGNFTIGNVTALAGLADDIRMIQHSAPVQPGNSGGPLFDQQGNVVGVIVSTLNVRVNAQQGRIEVPQNVNFAIRASVAQIFLEAQGVTPLSTPATTDLNAVDLADAARDTTVQVLCFRGG